ncbi:ThiF family adenylyltransferase [Actinoplanes hulinensis]|uniref:ThiF family adenylyltransferase n=1 Tax=Actinoplanes hulinensis TaxID=1144547 RepID=A0ABS7BEI7_9ACTN|nr:ThiF family adenylyltransferase [Actinoplanes hulinensis]MBW6439288.1 ThiF family adenylyltransferase [Actinoplanes hulinensis]
MASVEWRPRIKPEHGLYRMPDGRVRIGGAVYGVAAEVDDPDGLVWAMLSAADGTRSVEDIAAHVTATFEHEEPATVIASVQRFIDAGYLDNTAAEPPGRITPRDQQRYDRGRQFYRWLDLRRRDNSWEPQLRLKQARVTILGLGGTGGTAALALAGSGIGRIHCVDGDTVELSNLNRQSQFDEADIGRPKAEATASRLRRLNSDIEVTSATLTITQPAQLPQLTRDCDVFLLCADQPGEIRAWVNEACLDTGTPWVDAGYHGPAVRASLYTPGHGPCYECEWRHEHDRHRDTLPERPYSTSRGSAAAVTAVSAGLSGHLAAHLTVALITGVPAVEPGRPIGINLAVQEAHDIPPYGKHPRCPACGGRP